MNNEVLGIIIGAISLVVFWVSFFLKRKLMKDLEREIEENDKSSN